MSSNPPTALDSVVFRRACGQFATGVAIATTLDGEGNPHGLTINSFTSVSLTPPLVLICIDYRAAVLPYFRAAEHFGISFLNESQEVLSNRFAYRPDCRFEGTEWRPGVTGVPLIEGNLAALECRVERILEAGDHFVILGETVSAELNGGEPLLYYSGAYARLPR